MHPDICSFPSECFYGGQLVPAPELCFPVVKGYSWPNGYRVSLEHVDGKESQDESRSWKNVPEAEKVADLVKALAGNVSSLAVISFYKAQIHLIRSLIGNLPN